MRGRAILALALLAACDSRGGYRPNQLGPSVVEVRRAGAVIDHAPVGAGKHKGPGTYVLVDVNNPLSLEVHVTLEGDLLDREGRVLAELNPDSLRIPPGGLRTFALVHHRGEVREAASADIRVRDVVLAVHPPPIAVTDAHIYQDGDRVVVAAYLNNPSDREATVLVVAGFYDGQDRLMKRPFSVLKIQPESRQPARFVGPDGSASGYLFVGDQAY